MGVGCGCEFVHWSICGGCVWGVSLSGLSGEWQSELRHVGRVGEGLRGEG